MFQYLVSFDFNEMNEVMKLLKQLDCKIQEQSFDTSITSVSSNESVLCNITFSVRKSNSEQCEEKLKIISQLKLKLL